MNTKILGKEQFRKSFVLVLTIGYAIAFVALIGGFLQSLLLAAVFSGIVYPMYIWFLKITKGHSSLASLLTLFISLLGIVIPLVFLLDLIAEQAISITEIVKPWLQNQLSGPSSFGDSLPSWLPFADRLAPYSEEITAKLAQLAGQAGGMIAASLALLSEGAAVFFLQLFVMLYAMYFFLLNGPELTEKFMGYGPLTKSDKEKMVKVGLSVSRATVKGTLVIGVIQGMLGGIGFFFAGIDAAIFWAAVMAVLSVLPGIGSMLVWLPVVLFLLFTGDMVAGVVLFAWCAGIVGTVDNFLRPLLVGRDTEMPDLLILLSTLGGIGLFGVSGLVLGPILAALFMTVLTIYSTVFEDWLRLDESAENPEESGTVI